MSNGVRSERSYAAGPAGADALERAHQVAGEIASEVVCRGKSEGWSGTIDEREAVAAVLRPFGIVYVDDMRGAWAARRAATPAPKDLAEGSAAVIAALEDVEKEGQRR